MAVKAKTNRYDHKPLQCSHETWTKYKRNWTRSISPVQTAHGTTIEYTCDGCGATIGEAAHAALTQSTYNRKSKE